MRVIGTAGHVDHGKSTLIAALTGTHPDRLKEEQAREMTIELGFGWMTLPNGEEVGIVDVPGHRDFIENMLSGIGGIDAALLVIAADEGVMPQTREHLAILDILQIPTGIIVLTKTDLAPDSAWLDLVEADIRAAVKDTVMKDAPILRVSAKTKIGLESLVSNLETSLQQEPPRIDLGRPRLPIDRVFSISGFGTVVTGTLLDGQLAIGDDVEILPSGQKGRVRGLQTHKKKEDKAVPGSRTAVNISGIETESIQRGEVVVHPNQYQPTRRIDARFRLLKDVSSVLKHNSEVKFFVGASETARLRTTAGFPTSIWRRCFRRARPSRSCACLEPKKLNRARKAGSNSNYATPSLPFEETDIFFGDPRLVKHSVAALSLITNPKDGTDVSMKIF